MNIRKLCMHGALVALTAAGAVAIASPADARLACNQYGTCWWTGDTPDSARANSDYYAHKWGVRIVNGDRDRDYDRDYYRGYHHSRFHGNFEFNNGYYRDRDYDNDYDTY